ncbi:hypothetical protein OFK52_09560 [Acinetobacter baumannii]|uniref:hypothetical protein n=1 Tax=Acinetobacter baumannii TaxID=470 RepID=UPI00224F8CC6|nr:hypothetical protein [Acinetobacter baumannii]MCX3052919.1 hypothetical protein [Acinetobacter baumannii]
MQKPVKRGDAWRITVRYLGKRYTATRDTASECEQWAAKKLLELQSEQANPETENSISPSMLFSNSTNKKKVEK